MTVEKQQDTEKAALNQPAASNPQVDTTLAQQKVDTTLAQSPTTSTDTKEPESHEDPNWRSFREARKKDRAEREAAERKAVEKEAEVAALKAAMEAAFSKTPTPTYAPQDPYNPYIQEESEDQKLEKRINSIIAAREDQYRKSQAEQERQEFPNRLKSTLPDFSNVVSQENLDYLDYHFPEIARPLNRLQEGYDKWYDIYHAVKKLVPNNTTAAKESKRADINQQKPRSISSPTITQPQNGPQESWKQAEQRRQENWARMQKTLKGV